VDVECVVEDGFFNEFVENVELLEGFLSVKTGRGLLVGARRP